MNNVLVQFRRRYLICGRENFKNINVIDTPFLPFIIKIFSKPFLSTPLRTHTDISSKFHGSNFNSQDIFFYIYNTPVLPIYAPWNSNFQKCRNWFLRICMKNVLVQFRRRYLILRPRKCQKPEFRRYPRFNPLKSTLCAHWNSDLENAEIGL